MVGVEQAAVDEIKETCSYCNWLAGKLAGIGSARKIGRKKETQRDMIIYLHAIIERTLFHEKLASKQGGNVFCDEIKETR